MRGNTNETSRNMFTVHIGSINEVPTNQTMKNFHFVFDSKSIDEREISSCRYKTAIFSLCCPKQQNEENEWRKQKDEACYGRRCVVVRHNFRACMCRNVFTRPEVSRKLLINIFVWQLTMRKTLRTEKNDETRTKEKRKWKDWMKNVQFSDVRLKSIEDVPTNFEQWHNDVGCSTNDDRRHCQSKLNN